MQIISRVKLAANCDDDGDDNNDDGDDDGDDDDDDDDDDDVCDGDWGMCQTYCFGGLSGWCFWVLNESLECICWFHVILADIIINRD